MSHLSSHNFAEYFKSYTSLVDDQPFLDALNEGYKNTKEIVKSLGEEKGNYAYDEDKWTIKELLIHIIDCERIFCDRALRFARKDENDQLGFDHDAYVPNSQANDRTLKSIYKEYKAVRKSTLQLFKNFTEETLNQSGTANNNKLTVLTIGYIIAGHENHHMRILQERYLAD